MLTKIFFLYYNKQQNNGGEIVEKCQLPVIVLNDLMLLPYNELRLELDSKIGNQIGKALDLIDETRVLVVTKVNPLEETTPLKDMPRVGTISEITSKLELPNGKVRIVLRGIDRAMATEYNHTFAKVIEATVETIEEPMVEVELNIAITRKLKKELDSYIKMVPTISNSVIARIDSATTIGKITDIIVNYLSLPLERKREYLECPDSLKRTEMILADIYQEEALFEIEKRIDNKVKDSLEDSQKDYLLREKIKLIQEELGDVSLHDQEIQDLKKKFDSLVCSDAVREKILFELHRYEALSANSPEIGMQRNYLDCLLRLPWNQETKDLEDFHQIRKSLDASHYGLESVKTRIIEYLAVQKYSHHTFGPILCLVGPPGTGKTTLARSIAKSIGRHFVKISVGGVDDEAEIVGHRKSYLGASPGRIITGMMTASSNNPVFLIDEVDKLSKGIKGDPTSALLEVLDAEQNAFFHDNYLEMEYDLSNVMFILTANSTDNIPLPLLDRLEVIEISGYTELEKRDIAKKYLIPKLCKSHGLGYLKVYDQVILNIIRYYTKESGVRELERQLAKVIRKIVTSIVVNHQMERPILTVDNVEKYLGHRKFTNKNVVLEHPIGVVSALSYTPYGGEVLSIEVNYYKGSGKLILTGSLGDVLKESATLALSYIKANSDTFGIDYQALCDNDIHIHIPSGSITKDGPSAGVTLVTSLISAFAHIQLDKDIAMTGEITLRGNILPVGGLREKCLGAIRNHIHKIFIPRENLFELEDFPKEITDSLEFIPVTNYMEIYEALMQKK